MSPTHRQCFAYAPKLQFSNSGHDSTHLAMTDSHDGSLQQLEEEMASHEVTLRLLSQKNELLELQLDVERSKKRIQSLKLKSLRERKDFLERERETQEGQLREIHQSLEKCRDRSQRKNENQQSDEDSQESRQSEMNPSQGRKEDETQEIDALDQPMGIRVAIPFIHSDRQLLDNFWSYSGSNCLMPFLPCLNSFFLIHKVLDTSALETNVLDITHPESSNHRAESLKNTVLDMFSSMRIPVSPEGNKRKNGTFASENGAMSFRNGKKGQGKINPNHTLCPYELAGVCADIYCPYQHLQARAGFVNKSTIKRERLPLPPLRIIASKREKTAEKARTSRQVDKRGERRSEETVFDDVPDAKGENASSPVANTVMGESDKQSDLCDSESDFIALPSSHTEQICKTDVEKLANAYGRYDEEDTDSDDSASKVDSGESGKDYSFWWTTEEDLNRARRRNLKKVDSLSEWLQIRGGFRIANDCSMKDSTRYMAESSAKRRRIETPTAYPKQLVMCYESSFPETPEDLVTFIGRVVDCVRVAVHAGRFDIAFSLQQLSREALSELIGSFSEDKPLFHIMDRVACGVETATQFSFAYSSDARGVFHRAFDMQIVLAALSEYIRLLNANQNSGLEEKLGLLDEWREILESSLETFFNEGAGGSHGVGVDTADTGETLADAAHGSADEFIGVLSPDSALDKDWKVERSEIDAYRQLLSQLRAGKSILAAFREQAATQTPCQNLLFSSLSRAKQLMRRSTDFPNLMLRTTIFLGYLVLGYVGTALENLVDVSTEDADANAFATLSELESDLNHILLFLGRQLSRRSRESTELGYLAFAPLQSLNACLSAGLGLYGRTQLRLEAAISSSSVSQLSDLLWSQLAQLRACLPSVPETNYASKPSLGWLLPEETSKIHTYLARRIAQCGVNLNHVNLRGDWNLVIALGSTSLLPTCYSLVSSIFFPVENVEGKAGEVETCRDSVIEASREPMQKSSEPMQKKIGGVAIDMREFPFSTHPGQREAAPAGSVFPMSMLLAGSAIESLCLQRCSLKLLPETFGLYFENLQVLDVSENSISKLPASIGRLKSLKQLYAQQNQIRDFPSSLVECVHLEVLDLRKNRLEKLPTPDLPLRLPKLKTLLLDRSSDKRGKTADS